MNVQSPIRDIDPSAPRPKSRTGKRSGRPYLFVLFLCLIAGAGGYWYMSRNDSTASQPVIATVTRGDIEDVVTAVGSLTPLNSVDVGAQVSGQLVKLNVQIGDDVQKGALLAEIDTAVAAAKVDADAAQLRNFQAQLAEKQSQAALAQLQAGRQTRLMADNATSQDAFDTAVAAAKVAEAQVKSIEAQINQSQSTLKADTATLSYSKIYAPMTGTVTAIPAKQGQTLNANQQAPLILTISDLTTMTVSTQVSEADVPKLRIGMDAYFTTLGNPNRRFTGKLRQVLPTPTVTNNVVLYTALFDVANPNKQLMTQMTAQVFFVRAAAHDAITVPVTALRFAGVPGGRAGAGGARDAGAGQAGGNQAARAGRNGGTGRGAGGRAGAGLDPAALSRPRPATVTLVKDDGTQESRNVTVGVTDRVSAEILSGLNEGEKIIAGVQTANARENRQQQRPGAVGAPPGGPVIFR
ncbi:MAG TPA: efflux RND transporter periplasmic adaptor subunit [Micropepsaceae bacterium]|nr:efflux RND transporter periplasmic adaptor subunit [Micropepsaceae bacterium]